VLLALAAVALDPLAPAAAKAPAKPGKVRVDPVSTTAIKLRWKDKAHSETASPTTGSRMWSFRVCSPMSRWESGRTGIRPRATSARRRSRPARQSQSGSVQHAIVVIRDACELFELYGAEYRDGPKNRWHADSTAFFDLSATALRPDTYTSADAIGPPIFPGSSATTRPPPAEIDHAVQVTFNETRQAFIHPAMHHASNSCDPDRPAMGMRLRLKSSCSAFEVVRSEAAPVTPC
jgi:hypothetical protein